MIRQRDQNMVGWREEGESPTRCCFPGQSQTGISKPTRKSLQRRAETTATFPGRPQENEWFRRSRTKRAAPSDTMGAPGKIKLCSVQEQLGKRGRPWGLINITAPLGPEERGAEDEQRQQEQRGHPRDSNDSPVQQPPLGDVWNPRISCSPLLTYLAHGL